MCILYLHWDEEEAWKRSTNYAHSHVTPIWDFDLVRRYAELPNDALVINLDLCPSRGREIASWWYSSSDRAQTPVVFVGGDPLTWPALKQHFPRAQVFATDEEAAAALREAIATGAG